MTRDAMRTALTPNFSHKQTSGTTHVQIEQHVHEVNSSDEETLLWSRKSQSAPVFNIIPEHKGEGGLQPQSNW
jgi:hypothetical protein